MRVLNPSAAPCQVLVHGEAGGMMRLKEALRKQAALRGESRQFYTPALGQPVRIPHKAERTAKARPASSRLCSAQAMVSPLMPAKGK